MSLKKEELMSKDMQITNAYFLITNKALTTTILQTQALLIAKAYATDNPKADYEKAFTKVKQWFRENYADAEKEYMALPNISDIVPPLKDY